MIYLKKLLNINSINIEYLKYLLKYRLKSLQ